MYFDYEIDLVGAKIKIAPYTESEVETQPDDYTIPISKFWDFVTEHNLNTYCHDFFDPSQNDGHGQVSGTYTFEEYFNELHYEAIKEDLQKYLAQIS